jgi:hypothetical protein
LAPKCRRGAVRSGQNKANQRKVFISTGDSLISKLNNTMMMIIEDTFSAPRYRSILLEFPKKTPLRGGAKVVGEKFLVTSGSEASDFPVRHLAVRPDRASADLIPADRASALASDRPVDLVRPAGRTDFGSGSWMFLAL